MVLLQIAQDLALQLVLVQKIHRHDSIHHHYGDCNEAKGTASTMMVETVDIDQKQKRVCVEKMMHQSWILWSRHDTCALY